MAEAAKLQEQQRLAEAAKLQEQQRLAEAAQLQEQWQRLAEGRETAGTTAEVGCRNSSGWRGRETGTMEARLRPRRRKLEQWQAAKAAKLEQWKAAKAAKLQGQQRLAQAAQLEQWQAAKAAKLEQWKAAKAAQLLAKIQRILAKIEQKLITHADNPKAVDQLNRQKVELLAKQDKIQENQSI